MLNLHQKIYDLIKKNKVKNMRYTGPKLRVLRRLNIEKLPGLTTKSVRVGN